MDGANYPKNIKLPIEGMRLIPMGLPLMQDAWVSCVYWAAGKKEIRDQFKKVSGIDLDDLAFEPLAEKLFDKASGYTQFALVAFCDFVTEHIWGIEGQDADKGLIET